MKQREIQTSARSQIESRFEDINLLLSSCNLISAMIGVKNLSNDLRMFLDITKSINNEEHFGYMNRLDKLILDTEKTCICRKRK